AELLPLPLPAFSLAGPVPMRIRLAHLNPPIRARRGSMPVFVLCPCGKLLSVSEALVGTNVRCPECQAVFAATPVAAALLPGGPVSGGSRRRTAPGPAEQMQETQPTLHESSAAAGMPESERLPNYPNVPPSLPSGSGSGQVAETSVTHSAAPVADRACGDQPPSAAGVTVPGYEI